MPRYNLRVSKRPVAAVRLAGYLDTRPAPISRRQRAISRTAPNSVRATAVHSRLRSPTFGTSRGSNAYSAQSVSRRGSNVGGPMYQPSERVRLVQLVPGGSQIVVDGQEIRSPECQL